MSIFVLLKKLVVILLLMVYGLSSSGMTLQFHYCCGKLKSIGLTSLSEKQCGMKHSMQKKRCCDDKQVELKLKGEQKTEQAKIVFSTPDLPKRVEYSFEQNFVSSTAIVPGIFAPPPPGNPLYILHSVYRI
jgi:hypothetical protein